MPTSSMTRACSRISPSGSMVSCMTPTRKGAGVMPQLLAGEGAGELRAVVELAAERAAGALAADDHLHLRRIELLVLELEGDDAELEDAVMCGRRHEVEGLVERLVAGGREL